MTPKVVLASTPPFFTGDPEKFENFQDALTTYVAAYSDELDTPAKRILLTLSFLRNADGTSCVASDWVRNWKKRTLNADGTLRASYAFSDLMEELEKAFANQNLAQLAHIKLTSTLQGKMSLNEFLQQFELNAEQAGYSPHDQTTDYNAFLIELLEDNVSEDIMSQMYVGGSAVPTTYTGFKARLIQIDGNRQRGKIRRQRQNAAVAHKPKVFQIQKPHAVFSGPTPPPTKSNNDGVVPMELDNQGQAAKPFRCYNCGKLGHIKKHCPDPPKQKFNLRALSAEIDSMDAHSDVLKSLAEKLKEKGF